MYSNGCTDTSTIFIKADPIPDMSVKSVIIDDKCSLHSGVIDLVSSDLTQKIKYSSDGVTFYFDSIFLSNLAQGTYMIFLEHEKGCKDTLSYFINAFSPPIITHIDLSPPSCGKSDGSMAIFTTNSNDTIYLNGLIQPANTVSNLSQGTYHISVKNTRGCQKDTVINIEGKNLPVLPELITFDAHCNMDNGRIVITDSQPSVTYSIDGLHFFNNASFDSLSAGTYKFFVRNMEGCMITKDLIIGQTGSPTIDSVVVLDATCGLNNGSARVFAISYHGLDYRLMQDSIQPSPIFQHLSPGSYTLTVIDSFFCSSTQSFIIQDLYSINSIGKVSIKKGDCTQSLTHISFPEDSVISYTIINQNPSSDGTYYLLPGSYTIRVENENCYIDSTIQVSAISCTPFVPNIFSPNGDGINDLFKVEGSGFDVVSFHVFNRWGAEVFLASDNRGWDGVFRQSEAPQGVYVYFIQIKNDNHLYLLKGNVTLLR